jgi:hypothetical protein
MPLNSTTSGYLMKYFQNYLITDSVRGSQIQVDIIFFLDAMSRLPTVDVSTSYQQLQVKHSYNAKLWAGKITLLPGAKVS